MTGDTVRINLTVASDVPDKLLALAGSQRRMGEWLTDTIRQIYKERTEVDNMHPDVAAVQKGFDSMIEKLNDIFSNVELMRELQSYKNSKDGGNHGVQ